MAELQILTGGLEILDALRLKSRCPFIINRLEILGAVSPKFKSNTQETGVLGGGNTLVNGPVEVPTKMADAFSVDSLKKWPVEISTKMAGVRGRIG